MLKNDGLQKKNDWGKKKTKKTIKTVDFAALKKSITKDEEFNKFFEN